MIYTVSMSGSFPTVRVLLQLILLLIVSSVVGLVIKFRINKMVKNKKGGNSEIAIYILSLFLILFIGLLLIFLF